MIHIPFIDELFKWMKKQGTLVYWIWIAVLAFFIDTPILASINAGVWPWEDSLATRMLLIGVVWWLGVGTFIAWHEKKYHKKEG